DPAALRPGPRLQGVEEGEAHGVLQPGQTLRIVKLVAYGWSAERSVPALRAQVAAALSAARHTTWPGMLAEQEAYLADFWDRADVTIDGDPQLQHAVRFALFHTLQAGARTEGRGIPAKGLTGPGYDGHTFWDTESFVLPVLTYTVPEAAGDALRWRHSLIGPAAARAEQLGLRGSAFAWRTIAGHECSAYWPAGTAAFHINAAIADAVRRYVAADGGSRWEQTYGVDLLVATARLWASLGYFDAAGRFRIDGVTGPDEYRAVADTNVYTNLMARRNLLAAADAVGRHPGAARDVRADEVATWRRAADAMTIPFDADLGVHPQSERFTAHERCDFGAVGDRYPLMLHFPYFDLYRRQVTKQADLVLALYLCGDQFTDEEKLADFEYYEAITVRDSSLSACTQAIMAAETGHVELAYDYLGEAALMDLDDLEHNTKDGLHIASLAGAWLAVVGGFGGMRDHGGRLSFAPRLPAAVRGLTFNLVWRGIRLHVEVRPDGTTYRTTGGDLELTHHG
ncbi:MAG: glycoside hydrolase family 65 protein, partial [Acidimicrobiales bacterium]